MRLRRSPFFLALCALLWAAVVTLTAAGRPSPVRQTRAAASSPQRPAPPPSQARGFAGDDTCTACHESEGKSLRATLHGKAQNARTPAAKPNQSCETCHGPGREHAETGDKTKIRVFTAIAARDASEVCASCHNSGDHEFWQGSQHERRGLSCTTCHSVHNWNSLEKQLKANSVIRTCGNCHRDKLAKLDRSGHMPVREGKLECSTCHNPHGSQNVRLLRAGNTLNEACTSCHAEKRGPFLWDHAPVRENCATCHDPHGSANERLLVAKLPFLCQRCHSHTRHPSTIYDQTVLANSSRLYNRGCVNCHSNIHGSNHPSGHTFTR